MGSVYVLLMLFYLFIWLVSIGLTIVQIVALWKLYDKAGEPGWNVLIPVYGFMKMIKIATGSYKLAWIYLAFSGVYIISAFFIPFIMMFSTEDTVIYFVIIAYLALLILLIPMCIMAGYIYYMFAKAYGKSITFCVLSIFFSGITFIIMGLDKSTQYVGPNGIPQYKDYI